MKTGMLATLMIGWTVPASAQCVHDALRGAERAHAYAAELVALTAPHAHCTASWARAARRAAESDAAAEAVLAGLSSGDFCTARDAADHLKDVADDLQDQAEELEPARTPFGPCRDDVRRIERLADALEDLASDLYRVVRRLDDERFTPRPPVVRPFCGTTVPTIPVYPPYGVGPGPSYGAPHVAPYEYGSGGGGYDGLGPSLSTPPGDVFGPTPELGPQPYTPGTTHYRGVAPQVEPAPQALPPGLSKKSKIPPGQLKKIEPRYETGPSLLPPSASIHRGWR